MGGYTSNTECYKIGVSNITCIMFGILLLHAMLQSPSGNNIRSLRICRHSVRFKSLQHKWYHHEIWIYPPYLGCRWGYVINANMPDYPFILILPPVSGMVCWIIRFPLQSVKLFRSMPCIAGGKHKEEATRAYQIYFAVARTETRRGG